MGSHMPIPSYDRIKRIILGHFLLDLGHNKWLYHLKLFSKNNLVHAILQEDEMEIFSLL
jgi:hypothetical protein